MKTKLRLVCAFPIFLLSFYSFAQGEAGIWQEESDPGNRQTVSGQLLKPGQGKGYTLDERALRNSLRSLADTGAKTAVLYFPDASGELRPFRVQERSVMDPKLQSRYPEIRSYLGTGIGENTSRIRFSISPRGFQGMITRPGDSRARFIERAPGRQGQYLLFSRDQKEALPSNWKCDTEAILTEKPAPANLSARLVDDQVLRTYRLAVAATGEYTEYHGGTVGDALAAINATLTRINEVFERDLAIRLELIAGTDQVIYTDPSTDPFGGNFSAEVQTNLNTVIGSAEYDIGHLFHAGGEAGNAGFIGAVCNDSQKGSAYAATPTPEGDRFDLDFVAHEMGHQFGANHTWSFDSEGTGVQAEPASGSTIMGYAGIAEGNNVALTGDDYFHYYSIWQIAQYASGTACATLVPLADNPPVITPGPDYIIPQGTAFVLEGVASDPDAGDILTYAWEQIDDGVVTTASFGPENPGGANFRSRRPVTDPKRYFPMLSRVVAGALTQVNPPTGSAWETVSTIERDFNFALTVRDNAPGGGQVASDLVKVSVLAGSVPFEVLSQQSPQTYLGGSIQSVSWSVAGTDQGPINCQEVDIYLSLDAGQSFPVLLASGIPNTGNAQVQLPGTATIAGRIMVKAADNVFFAVNSANITITEQPFMLASDQLTTGTCQPSDALLDFTYYRFGSFSEEVTLDVSGLPAGLTPSFSLPTVQADSTDITLTISNTAAAVPGTYPLVLSGTGPETTFSFPFELRLSEGSFTEPVLLSPADDSAEVGLDPVLQWQSAPEYTSYRFQLATDAAFTSVVAEQVRYTTQYHPESLMPDTQYYWRVRPVNSCGEGPYGPAFTFRTIASDCKTLSAQGLPLAISATGTPTITSSIFFADDRPVIGARVNLDISHSYLSDLIVTLRSPAGTEVTLIANSCAEANDLSATFEAGAPPFVCANNPAISGTVRPLGSLNSFTGESSFGQWVLTIEDTAPADGGQLNAFSLELCVEGQFRPDADGDGVFDDGDDLCLGTPPGTPVDANGCPVYRFAPDQFEITLSGEKCFGSADGAIEITAAEPLDYTVTIVGNGVNETAAFNNSYELRNLSSGTYEVCITGTDGSIVYEAQCYEVNIAQQDPLSLLVNRTADGSALDLQLNGAEAYTVILNGAERLVTSSTLTLELASGVNTLKVTAVPSCKGSYEATYYSGEDFSVAPNPFGDFLEIYVPEPGNYVEAELFTTAGSVAYRSRVLVGSNRLVLPVPALPPGIYVLRLRSGTREKMFKLYHR